MRLPNLNALRAFESAARHGGFKDAATELNVTRGAVSRHIKALEAELGVTLFRRHPRGVTLTSAGQRLCPMLTEVFNRLHAEIPRLVHGETDLHVLCPPATSIRWLIPRLDDFRARHPDIRLRLTTDFHTRGRLSANDVDIAFSVMHWPGRAPGMRTEPVFDIDLTPMCSPDMAALLARPEDLSDLPLLHETSFHGDWMAWQSRFAVPGLDVGAGHVFPNLDMAIKAALMDQGVVMGDLVLCRDELESGTLVAPFPEMVVPSPTGAACLIGDGLTWDQPAVAAFRAWARHVD